MDILLVDPPYASLKGMPTSHGYHVGLTGLAAYLQREGIETRVLSGDLLVPLPATERMLRGSVGKYAAGQRHYETIVGDSAHFIWQKIADAVRTSKPLAAGISYLTPLKYSVERTAHVIKETDPNIKVIAGSFHPTFCADEVMQNPDIDFVVAGEGEIPLLALARELNKEKPAWELVPGISYRDGQGRVQHNPPAAPIKDLDSLPFPVRELVMNCDYSSYRVHSISTTRGCPYSCSFCADKNFWGGGARRRSVASVIAELKLLKQSYKVDYVDIIDGTFTFDPRYLEAFCEAITGLDIRWRCTARYDNLDPAMLRMMKKAGCAGLYLGLESGSDRVLKSVDKKITVDRILDVSGMIHSSGIFSATSILLGLPEETSEDIEDTLSLMRQIKTDLFDVNVFVPLPGSQLYDSMPQADRGKVDWRKDAYKSLDTCFSKNIPRADFERFRSEAYDIAGRVQRKTAFKFAVRSVLQPLAGLFR